MIDPDRRRALQARRRQLQAELKRRARRVLIREATALLDRRGIAYRMLDQSEPFHRWIGEHFPVSGTAGEIDWARVPNHAHLPPGANEAASAWLRELATAQLHGSGDVIVLWSNAGRPALELGFPALADCPELLSDSLEAWALSKAGNWIVEYTAVAGWHWALAPSTAEPR